MKSVETYLHDIQDELCDKIVHHWEDDQRFANQREMQQYNCGVAEATEIIRNVLYGREFKSPLLQSMKECRAAVEKQTAKKVKSISQVKDGDSYVGLIGRCPCCGDILEEDTVYCDCGQRLDWETSNEIDSKRNS